MKSLFSLIIVLILTSTMAFAQNSEYPTSAMSPYVQYTCGRNDGYSSDYEIGFKIIGLANAVDIYVKELSGQLATDAYGNVVNKITVSPGGNVYDGHNTGCDYVFFMNAAPNHTPAPGTYTYLLARPYVIEFHALGRKVASFTYRHCSTQQYGGSFYCPYGNSGATDYFLHYVSNTPSPDAVQVVPHSRWCRVRGDDLVPVAPGCFGYISDGHKHIREYFSDANWIMPHNSPNVLCLLNSSDTESCLGSLPFITPQDAIVSGRVYTLTAGMDLLVPLLPSLPFTWNGSDVDLLRFQSNTKLQVNGTLNTTNVTFTSASYNWGGIRFSSGSSGSIVGGSIDNASGSYGAIHIDMTSPTIDGVMFNSPSSSSAIYINGYQALPHLKNNTITGGGLGVKFDQGASGTLYRNTIKSAISVQAQNYSTVYLRTGNAIGGENRLQGSSRALVAYNGVFLDAGNTITHGKNCFYSNANPYNIYSHQSTVYAGGNYWHYCPSGTCSTDWSEIYQSPHGSVSPAPILGWNSVTCGSSTFSAAAASVAFEGADLMGDGADVGVMSRVSASGAESLREKLERAHFLVSASERSGATASLRSDATRLFKEIVQQAEEAPEAIEALVGLWRVARMEKAPGLRGFFESLAAREGSLQPTALGILVQAYQFWNDEASARVVASRLEKAFAETRHAFYGQMSLYWLHVRAGRYSEAEQVLSRVKPLDASEAEALEAAWQHLAEESGSIRGDDASTMPEVASASAASQEKLVEVYPNPFNPATKIQYTLSSEGLVRLKIYDVLGREVETLVDGLQHAGRHEAVFEASELPSGVYLYHLEVAGRVYSGTMLLLK